jgi:hypothetical protein
MNKPHIVVSALLHGLQVPLGGRTLKLFRKGDTVRTPSFGLREATGPWLGMLVDCDGDTAWMGYELSFEWLVALSEKLSDEDAGRIAAQVAVAKGFGKGGAK